MSREALADKLVMTLAHHGYYPAPLIELGVLIALADGVLEEDERDILKDLFCRVLGIRLSDQIVMHLIDAGQDVLKEAGIDERMRFLAEVFKDCDCVEDGIAMAAALIPERTRTAKRETALLVKFGAFCGLRADEILPILMREHGPETGSASKIASL